MITADALVPVESDALIVNVIMKLMNVKLATCLYRLGAKNGKSTFVGTEQLFNYLWEAYLA